MAYPTDSTYIRSFDPTQSPLYLQMLAGRHGIDTGGSEKLYLDLGCASGHTILALAALYPDWTFAGIDLNPTHIEQGNAEAQRLGLSNVELVHKDFTQPQAFDRPAPLVALRGTYSWLSETAKQRLEAQLGQLLAPGGLLKLHHIVKPGSIIRETWINALHSATKEALHPKEARKLLRELATEAKALQSLSPNYGKKVVENMLNDTEEGWSHDILNRDFRAEEAGSVYTRLEKIGMNLVCSCMHVRNLKNLLISPAMLQRIEALPRAQQETLIDHLTANGARDDLLVYDQVIGNDGAYDRDIRFGLLAPDGREDEPFETLRGKVLFQREDCQAILKALKSTPRTLKELSLLPNTGREPKISQWIDLLLAAGRIIPFLPSTDVARVDVERIRMINRARIESALGTLSQRTRVPLLGAELGNCLEAGWFETLVLAYFQRRYTADAQHEMLSRMHAAGLFFGGQGGKPADDQMTAMQTALARLETSHIMRMPYWGICV